MTKIVAVSLAILCSLVNQQAAFAQTDGDFRSAGSGNWTSAGSWQRFNGTAWVAAADAPEPTDGIITIMPGHNITVDLNLDADQVVVSAGATLTIDHSLLLINSAGEDLIVYGTLQWESGSIGNPALPGPGTTLIDAGATVIMTGPGNKGIGGSMTNNGHIDWQDGPWYFGNAIHTITNNGTFTISGNNTMQNFSGGASLVNNGTITKTSSGTTDMNFSSGIFNNGTINLNAGTVTTLYEVTNTGAFVFNGGSYTNRNVFNYDAGTITGTGTFTNLSELNLVPDLHFTPGFIFATNTSHTVQGAGDLIIDYDMSIDGHYNGPGALIIHGNTVWNSGIISRPFTIESGRTLSLLTTGNKVIAGPITNNGHIDWQNGNIGFNGNTTLTNNNTMAISGNNAMQNGTSFGYFINSGTVTKSSTGLTTFFLSGFTNNAGAIFKSVGTVSLGAAFTYVNNGLFAPGLSPGQLTLNGIQPFTAAGTLQIEMQDASGPGTGHDQLIRNSNLTLNGTLSVIETGTVPNGTYTIIELSAGTISGSFATVNLPTGYTLQQNTTNVQLIKNLVVTPVTFVSFTGTVHGNTNVLRWVTEHEVNHDHFEVERSADGIQYQAIARVKTYNYTDEWPLPGQNFYRLKQVDKDGAYLYSSVVLLRQEASSLIARIYPNPVKDLLYVQLPQMDQPYRLSVFDAAGELLLVRKTKGEPLVRIPVAKWSTGMYTIRIAAGAATRVIGFMKY